MSDKKAAAPEAKAEETHDEKLVRATTRALMEEMMPAMVAMMRSGSASGTGVPAGGHTNKSIEAAEIAQVEALTGPVCQECGQKVKGCKNKHVKIVVFPKENLQYAEYFQGVFINGVRYLSNHPGHAITVPENAAGDIEYKTRRQMEEEVIARTGRSKQHNGGELGSPQNSINPAVDGFR